MYRNGMGEPGGTWFSALRAATSWNVMPVNSGVVTVRSNPLIARIAGASRPGSAEASGSAGAAPGPVPPIGPGTAPPTRCPSQRMPAFEHMFEAKSKRGARGR
ncbi:hypothetical protein GCM10027456_75060 [Kineosporia babensis]